VISLFLPETDLLVSFFRTQAVILDANLTLHTPQGLWLSTGIRFIPLHPIFVFFILAFVLLSTRPSVLISRSFTSRRALDHAIETLYRKGSQGPLKHLALASIQELFICLPLCKEESENVEIRERLQIAAW